MYWLSPFFHACIATNLQYNINSVVVNAATSSHRSRSALEPEEEVWYLASDEVQPYNNTSTNTTISDSMKPKGSVSLREKASTAKKQKSTADGQVLPTLLSSQHQSSKSVVGPQESADLNAQVQTSTQKEKCPIDRLITQKLYGRNFEEGKMEGSNPGSHGCE